MGIFIAGGVVFHRGICLEGSGSSANARFALVVVKDRRRLEGVCDCCLRARAQLAQTKEGRVGFIVVGKVRSVDKKCVGGLGDEVGLEVR